MVFMMNIKNVSHVYTYPHKDQSTLLTLPHFIRVLYINVYIFVWVYLTIYFTKHDKNVFNLY